MLRPLVPLSRDLVIFSKLLSFFKPNNYSHYFLPALVLLIELTPNKFLSSRLLKKSLDPAGIEPRTS